MTTKIQIVENSKPEKIKQCAFLCDKPLHPRLDDFELTRYLNKHSTNLFCGRPGSGKTSFLYSLFATKDLMNKIYDNIFVFQPSQSRSSMSDKIFDKLDEDKKFDELTFENLNTVLERIKAEPESNHAIIMDDVGAYLRDDIRVRNLLKEIMMNKRHYHISLYCLTQSWKSAEPTLRKLFDNIFIWKISKKEMVDIFDEVVEGRKDDVGAITKLVYDKPYNFLMINVGTQSMFKNFDSIKFSDE